MTDQVCNERRVRREVILEYNASDQSLSGFILPVETNHDVEVTTALARFGAVLRVLLERGHPALEGLELLSNKAQSKRKQRNKRLT